MADDPQTPPENEDELLLTEEHQPDAPEAPGPDEGDEVEVPAFSDETEEKPDDTGLAKHLREEIKKRDRELAELRRGTPAPAAVDPGPEPTLESCGYDEDKLKLELREWDKKVEQAKKPAVDQQAQAQAQWEAERARYTEGKAKIAAPDVDDAEETVKAALTPEQQTILVMASDDPAKLMYALAKNPAKLTELAGEGNFFKLAAKVAKLEGSLKMVKRRTPLNVDTPERGSARMSPESGDKKLAKLEKEAEASGDRTKVIAYKRELRQAAQQ